MIFPIALAVILITLAYLAYFLWPMRMEGFAQVDPNLFIPKVTPGGYEEHSVLSPSVAMDPSSEKLVESSSLPAMDMKTAVKKWGTMTSETCYHTDLGESLKKTRNYAQRTNNYTHEQPDSCSAPNH